MINRTKQGFSLVEVMILFTVLAIAMAAALPVITRKSLPVPRPVTHGVYRCIATGEGYKEEVYNAFRQMSTRNIPEGQTCQFRVPNALLFNIDIYSAGAGGTLYAAYRPQNDDNRRATFDMDNAVEYAESNGQEVPFEYAASLPAERRDMIYRFTDKDVKDAFSGEESRILQTASTGNAGKGGMATQRFWSPSDAACEAFLEYGDVHYRDREQTTEAAYEEAKAKRKAVDDEYERNRKNLEQKSDNYQDYIDINDGTIEKLTSYNKTLQDVYNTLETLQNNITEFLEAGTTNERRVELYNQIMASAAKNCRQYADEDNPTQTVWYIFSNYKVYFYKTNTPGGTVYSYRYSPSLNGSNVLDAYSRNMVSAFNEIDVYMNDNARHQVKEYNEDGEVIFRDASTEERMQDLMSNSVYKNKLKQLGSKSNNTETKVYKFQHGVELLKEQVQAGIDNYLKPANESLQASIDKTESDIADLDTKYNESKTNGELKRLIDDENEKEDRYNTAKQNNTKYQDDKYQKYKSRPSQYNDNSSDKRQRFDLEGDNEDADWTETNVARQISDYCKAQYPDYYSANNAKWNDSRSGVLMMDQQFLSQGGGEGGSGVELQLDYLMDFSSTQIQNRYMGNIINNQGRNFREFPYVKFIGDMYGNVDNHGYAITRCTTQTGKSGDFILMRANSCEAGATPQNGRSGDTNSTAWEAPSGNIIYRKAEKGGDVQSFLTFKVPGYITQNSIVGNGDYRTIESAVAIGGDGGVVGYEMNELTYGGVPNNNVNPEHPNLKTNLAWSAFRGENPTVSRVGNSISVTDGANPNAGADTTIGNTASMGSAYTIREYNAAEGRPRFQQPRMEMQSDMWTKRYNVGHAGSHGDRRHFQVVSMGTHCTLTVPQGGLTFDYMKEVHDAQTKGIPIATYLEQRLVELQGVANPGENDIGPLDTNITCINRRDKDDKGNPLVVLNETVRGGKYNITVNEDWISPFYWNENVAAHAVRRNEENVFKSNFPEITSRWARILYRMTPLRGVVSDGGMPTILIDKCVAPYGTTQLLVYRMTSNDGLFWTHILIPEKRRDHLGETNGHIDNDLQGYDCYNTDLNSDIRVLDHTKMTDDDTQYYQITPPQPAKGGAVVITW